MTLRKPFLVSHDPDIGNYNKLRKMTIEFRPTFLGKFLFRKAIQRSYIHQYTYWWNEDGTFVHGSFEVWLNAAQQTVIWKESGFTGGNI